MSDESQQMTEEEKQLQEKKEQEMSDSIEESIKYWQNEDVIDPDFDVLRKTLKYVMGFGETFDVNFREMTFGGRHTGLLFITGLTKDTILTEILKRLSYVPEDELSSDALEKYFEFYIPHIQVSKVTKLSEAFIQAMSGMSVFFVEGETTALIIDTRSYPSRGPEEPSLERVVRGARDGFTETMLTNVSLVRRRLHDPGFKLELFRVGERTKTDVCLAYIDDIVDKVQVETIRKKIESIDIDGIPLADKQLEEIIINRGWHPYPLVRYSERPDSVASHLLEGRVVLFVDTSPSVMIMPTTFFDLCQHAEENRQTPFMGSYLRIIRIIGILASLFLLPLWMLFVIDPGLKPEGLDFIGPQENVKLPIILQFLIVEFGIDLMRMAAVHTPTPLASAMGLIAAILIGDVAVKTGLFVNEVLLYMAVAAVGMFATPSYELGLANRMVRLILLVLVAIFKVPGLVVGTTAIIIGLALHRSYNSSYLWPLIPFNAKGMLATFVRSPVLTGKKRPSFNKPRDNTRMP
ncbi:spore germination protein [Paenibacillus shunpengii]|uniref:Spore germination protein n=1 Tax=Paenibacillus shunpengii TaxID=2054424 RepID=A0ABW5SRP2_9BACL|nr:spore germination protein [Paenibacillus sp. PDC88]SDW53647.1 stage V sporulation protein AF [Paenibacillus sp. PDC88]